MSFKDSADFSQKTIVFILAVLLKVDDGEILLSRYTGYQLTISDSFAGVYHRSRIFGEISVFNQKWNFSFSRRRNRISLNDL